MRRLGLAGRLILFIAVIMLLVQALTLVAYLVDRQQTMPTRQLIPGTDQIEATVLLFDSATAEERKLLQRALAGSELKIQLRPERPGDGESFDLLLPRLMDSFTSYSEVLADRDIRLTVRDSSWVPFLPEFRSLVSPVRIRVEIGLSDGSWLTIQRRTAPGLTIGGMPLGLISAALATLLAVVAIIVVWLETRPLRRLAEAAGAFGRDLVPKAIPLPRAPDLKALVLAFNDMQERIARADRNRADMLAALSHDVRTPLTRLTLRLRKLDPDLQDAAARDIGQIERVADAAFQLTQADRPTVDDLCDLRDMLRALAEEADIAFVDEAPDMPAPVRGSRQLLERAVANLIDNALKYGTCARVILTPGRDIQTVAVEDDGPGIPADDRDRLLQPFQRGEVARTDSVGGNGLGLALAGRIIARHGGQLALGTAPAGGLRAAFTLDTATTARPG